MSSARTILAKWGFSFVGDETVLLTPSAQCSSRARTGLGCGHAREMSVQEVLDENMGPWHSIGRRYDRCGIFKFGTRELTNIISLVVRIEEVENIEQFLQIRDIQELQSYQGLSQTVVHVDGKSFAEVCAEKINEFLQENPHYARAAISEALSKTSSYSFNEEDITSEDLSYICIFEGYRAQFPSVAANFLYGSSGHPDVFIVPSNLIGECPTNLMGSMLAGIFKSRWGVPIDQEFPTIPLFGPNVLLGVMPVMESDTPEMLENLTAFTESMTFREAVLAARHV